VTTATTLTLLDRWLRIERAEAARHRALDASGQHSAAADAAEHEDRVRILEALRGVVETLQPGDREAAARVLATTARVHRGREADADAARLERVGLVLDGIAEALGR
jgi:hypothetical protein